MKKIYFIACVIACFIIYFKYNTSHKTSDDYYKHTYGVLVLDKNEYRVNEEIVFTYKFMKKNVKDKKIKIIMCDSEDKAGISFMQDTRLNYIYKKIYPETLWQDINISKKKYTKFVFSCDKTKANKETYKTVNLKLVLKKEKRKYFLTNGTQRINLSNIPYYVFKPFLYENVLSSGDHGYCLEKFIYMRIKHETLFIQVSDYVPPCISSLGQDD